MSISPIITFKAGCCDLDQSAKPYKVKAQQRAGYIYLYSEDDLIHFCWRERSAPLHEPELDLVMVPTDGRFVPYDSRTVNHPTAKTNGRIFVLKFTSSSQRHLFWLQSKPQGRTGDPSWFSPRDLKIGDIVDRLLQGEEFDINRELAQVRNGNDDDQRDEGDEDEPMEDVEGHGGGTSHGGSGGAGPGATGGDVRSEGEDAREGGADGARAASSSAPDAAAAVESFLRSLNVGSQQSESKAYPLLTDLLETNVTIPMIDAASEAYVDNLLNFLPPVVLVLAQHSTEMGDVSVEPSAESLAAAKSAMSLSQKKALLKKVLRSPQFHQSLNSLSMALRDGGLPSIAEALGVQVENGGLVHGRSMPLGGGEAVEAFVEGVKKTVQEK